MTADWTSMNRADLLEELRLGGRLVIYSYCVSIGILTLTRESKPRLIRSGRSAMISGLPWITLTFLAGWWGIPWGPIRTVQCLANDLRGGRDVTDQVVDVLL